MYSFNITQIQSGVLYTVVVSTVAEGRSGAAAVLASAPSVKSLIPSVFTVCIIVVSFPGLHPQAPYVACNISNSNSCSCLGSFVSGPHGNKAPA